MLEPYRSLFDLEGTIHASEKNSERGLEAGSKVHVPCNGFSDDACGDICRPCHSDVKGGRLVLVLGTPDRGQTLSRLMTALGQNRRYGARRANDRFFIRKRTLRTAPMNGPSWPVAACCRD